MTTLTHHRMLLPEPPAPPSGIQWTPNKHDLAEQQALEGALDLGERYELSDGTPDDVAWDKYLEDVTGRTWNPRKMGRPRKIQPGTEEVV